MTGLARIQDAAKRLEQCLARWHFMSLIEATTAVRFQKRRASVGEPRKQWNEKRLLVYAEQIGVVACDDDPLTDGRCFFPFCLRSGCSGEPAEGLPI